MFSLYSLYVMLLCFLQLRELFNESAHEVVQMRDPDDGERREFFEDLLLRRTSDPPVIKNSTDC